MVDNLSSLDYDKVGGFYTEIFSKGLSDPMRVLRNFLIVTAVLAAALSFAPVGLRAKDTEKDTEKDAEKVELFDAIDQGLIEVKLKQNGALEGNLTVKNLSGQPLEIDVPSAFAAVPIAQMMAMMGGGGNGGGMMMMAMMGGAADPERGKMGIGSTHSGLSGGASSGNQSVGGSGRGGLGGGRGGRGGRGGGWFVSPEKTVRTKIRTVCLEHGKRDPFGGQEYALVPLDTITTNKTTHALVEMLGDDSVDQQALQAAVWNQENGISMDELSEKVYQPAGNVTPRPWFSEEDLDESIRLIEEAECRAEEIIAEEAVREKAEAVKIEEDILASDTHNGNDEEIDNTIENLTKALE